MMSLRRLSAISAARPMDFSRKKPNGKTHVDLRGANARRLLQLGLKRDNIDVSDECTMCLPDKYWSHRATDGVRGSMAAAIVL